MEWGEGKTKLTVYGRRFLSPRGGRVFQRRPPMPMMIFETAARIGDPTR